MSSFLSEAPDVNLARDRLENLLKNIRTYGGGGGSAGASNGRRASSVGGEEDEGGSDNDNSDSDNRHKLGKFSPTKRPSSASSLTPSQSSKKKRRPVQKKIIFELRQKAFEIQHSNMEHGLYALCRIWMRGKDNKESIVAGQPIDRSTIDYDHESFLAAKAITRKSTVRPEASREDATSVTGEEESPTDILNQYLPRWRKVKKDWCQQRNENDVEKYGDSLRVLREMHASAHNHVII